MDPVIVISDRDNVATALEPLGVGDTVRASGAALVIVEPIPRGHKVALRAIRFGEPIVKYGSSIGTATMEVAAGAHVHVHNVASTRGRGDLATGESEAAGMRLAEPSE
jgi:altronate dehydratase